MTEAQRWTVKCQDPADGSRDVIIDLPPDLPASLGLSIGQRRDRQAQSIEKAKTAGKYQGRPPDADLHKRV